MSVSASLGTGALSRATPWYATRSPVSSSSSSMKTTWLAVTSAIGAPVEPWMRTVSGGPPLTDAIQRTSATPMSSSARASMNTSSIELTSVSRPGLLNEIDGPWSASTSIR